MSALKNAVMLLACCAPLAACCDTEAERSVTATSVQTLQVTDGGTAASLSFLGHVVEGEIESAAFRDAYGALTGSAPGVEGLMLTLAAQDPVTEEVITLILALPASLQAGSTYNVNRAFSVPFSVSQSEFWGGRDLAASGDAEVALVIARYTFPPATYTVSYQATAATGSILVLRRGANWVELSLSLQLTDDTGRAVGITGTVQSQAQQYEVPCT